MRPLLITQVWTAPARRLDTKLGLERSGNHATRDLGINAEVREQTTLDQALNDGDAHAVVSFWLTYWR